MRLLKTKNFYRWAKKEGIKDSTLRLTIVNIQNDLIDADLGGGLIKQRIAKKHFGKSRSYRTLIAIKKNFRAIFIFGFKKSDLDNIDDSDLALYKKIAAYYLSINSEQIEQMVNKNSLIQLE